MISLLQVVHRLYKLIITPLLGENCRFFPSCSDYAMAAIEKHGFFWGALLGVKRVCKCHPFCKGGLDPVPEVSSSSVQGLKD